VENRIGPIAAALAITVIAGGVLMQKLEKPAQIDTTNQDKVKLMEVCKGGGKSESECAEQINKNFEALRKAFLNK
jgi:hypothetical protein